MRSQKTSLYNDTFLRIGSLCICLTALIGTSFLGMKLHGISDHQNRFFYAWRDSLSAGTDSLCIPTNIHLAPITNVDLKSHMMNMTLSFTLPEECSPSTTTTVIRYGYNETTFLTQSNETFQFTYTAFVRSYESSWIHHAVLKDLRAGEELYWYQIQAWKNEESSSTQSNSSVIVFSTPPLPLEAVSIALIGDWGGSPEAVRTMQRMTNVSLVVVAGDISYANSNLPQWEDWLRIMQPLLAQTPLLVAAGNHEIECNRETFQVFQAYESYFRNPNRIGPAHLEPIPRQFADSTHPAEFETTYWYGNSFYSYRHGLLQIIVLNSYTDTSKESVQYQWLQKELERVDRAVTPWLLIVFHCPFHTTFRGHNDEQNPRRMMQSMESLFVQYQVNMILSGHNHAYVRTFPMIGQAIDPHGPIYLTIGTGGESHAQGPLRSHDAWVAHRDNTEYGFGRLHVLNVTHAYLERVLNHESNPKAMDSVWIQNILEDSVASTLKYTQTT